MGKIYVLEDTYPRMLYLRTYRNIHAEQARDQANGPVVYACPSRRQAMMARPSISGKAIHGGSSGRAAMPVTR